MNKNFTQLVRDEFKEYINNPEVVLIDIRRDDERSKYWQIREDQKVIVFWSETLEQELQNLDKNTSYALYCWHWQRSASMRDYMKKIGFKNVVDLEWGIDAWV